MTSSFTNTTNEIDQKTPAINKAILEMGTLHNLTETEINTRLNQIFNEQKEHKHIGGNAQDSKKRTPLINAARLGNLEAVNWLLNHEEHPDNTPIIFYLDETGMSALAHAVSYID